MKQPIQNSTLKRILTTVIAILTITFLLAGCDDNPFSSNSPKGNQPTPGGEEQTFELVEVTISGIGTQQMSAKALPAGLNVAADLEGPNNGGPSNGTIQMKPVSNGSFTVGTRGSGGMRYLYATFKVRNADAGGNEYGNARQNLTFIAVDTDQTYGITAVSELRLFDGTKLTGNTAENIAKNTIPTGAVYRNFDGKIRPQFVDVLQVFTETAVAGITTESGVEAFPYGFVTRSPNITPGSRKFGQITTQGVYHGVVTFAFKIPLQAQANQDPFEISVMFLPVDDSQTRITQSLEEQNAAGRKALAARVNNLNPAVVTLLPGSSYPLSSKTQFRCAAVRVAGTQGSPAAILLFPPGVQFTRLKPDPYAPDGSASHIASPTDFEATFSGKVSGADARSFVVQGFQSGQRFIGQAYSGNGTPTATTPAGSFFPGEIVEISLTSDLNLCQGRPVVARYRVKTANAPATFDPAQDSPFSVGNFPFSMALGDLDGDGTLDMAVVNFLNATVSVLLGNGDGTFSEVAGSPFYVGYYPASVAMGDLDGDGILDMAVANSMEANVSVLLGNGDGAFSEAGNNPVDVGSVPASVTLGDLNGDGILDMAVANSASNNVSVLLGNGDGAFAEATGSPVGVGNSPFSVALGDLDGDGILDMASANDVDNRVSVLLGNGDGTFSEAPGSPFDAGNSPRSIQLGDLDGDGNLDMVVTNFDLAQVTVLLGNGDGTFSEAGDSPVDVGLGPISVALGDLDGDRDLDMTVSNADGGSVSVLLNR